MAPQHRWRKVEGAHAAHRRARARVIGIGAEGDDPGLLLELLEGWRPMRRPAIVLQTRLEGFPAVELLQAVRDGRIDGASFATDGQDLRPGAVLVVPPRWWARVGRDGIRLERSDSSVPVLDWFFASLGDAFGAESAAVLLATGERQGVRGLEVVAQRGGVALAGTVTDPAEREQQEEELVSLLPAWQFVGAVSDFAD